MKLRIIQLEDSAMKHSAISRVIKNVVPAEIDWVTDMYSGIKKIDEAYWSGIPYDLAITDMHEEKRKAYEERLEWTTILAICICFMRI